jgi:hypothetical protein
VIVSFDISVAALVDFPCFVAVGSGYMLKLVTLFDFVTSC